MRLTTTETNCNVTLLRWVCYVNFIRATHTKYGVELWSLEDCGLYYLWVGGFGWAFFYLLHFPRDTVFSLLGFLTI